MLGAVFKGSGNLVLEEVPEPVLKRNSDVLIRVQGVGICGSDLHILQVPPAHPAKKGIVLGHEFTGEIVKVGDQVTDFKPGDSVLVDPHPGCGLCSECKRGNQDRCILLYTTAEPGHPNTIGVFSDGGMTEYVVVPRQSVYRVDSKVPAHIRAMAEPLACVLNAFAKVNFQPGESALVLGSGPIGLMFVSLFKAAGADPLIVSEPSEFRRKASLECGATAVFDPTGQDLQKFVTSVTDRKPDVVVEAVGPLLPEAIELVGVRGRVLQFGHDETVNPTIPVGTLLKKEVVIYGAFIGRHSFEKTAAIMESDLLPLNKIVSHRLPLKKVHEGINLVRRGEGIKVIIEP